jgi:hypothetical protein
MVSLLLMSEGCLYQEGGELNLGSRGVADRNVTNGSKPPVYSFEGIGLHHGAIVAISLTPINQSMISGCRSFGDRRNAGLNVEVVTTVD